MTTIRSISSLVMKEMIHISPLLRSTTPMFPPATTISMKFRYRFRFTTTRLISSGGFRCMAASNSGDNKVSSRLSQMQQLIHEAEELASSTRNEPTPIITLDHVSVSFARSGGPGGQNVNKVNTKVDMRFNVKKAYWLSERIRERILQLEKNRINKEGEIVISSTKTRTQKGNIEDALAKLQAIIDAAAYVPPPPSEEQKKKLAKIWGAEEAAKQEGPFTKKGL
ncbi:hypothetical protein AQUCO_01300628v1 [Aquilegia coerulea]|uniref:Prokaryotic-type class I peptide chain release factors domain-containing protein n=1 Tax=Aquilegia coerulea TaxID=218851 RepID=A0A2G5E2T8_AQUCA|nr:hypothetical protein AQUCO_01300628v1 [Aquilegia coerulea]